MQQQENQNQNQHLENFWRYFFKEKYSQALYELENQKNLGVFTDKDFYHELKAKIYLRQGEFKTALNELKSCKKNSGFNLFTNFLITGEPKNLLLSSSQDIETRLYKSQALILTRIYWGEEYLESIGVNEDSDELLEKVFEDLLNLGEIDKAILAGIQSLEMILEDQLLSHDLNIPIIKEHLENLLELSNRAKYDSTKAKIFLVKARILKDLESAKDAEILFGKDQNLCGLGEVYLSYAKDFGQNEYYPMALKAFQDSENLMACGFVHEALASNALISGNVLEANTEFQKAKEYLDRGGIFEYYGLEIQRISLIAISGKYQTVKEAIHALIEKQPPPFFLAQAYQILSNTLIQTGDDYELAKGYIEAACDIFYRLKRYNQLLYTRNVQFQILLLQNDLELIYKIGQEVIQLATRLGNEEIKASKYLDLAFVTIRINLEEGNLNEEKIAEAGEFFKKAIALFQEQGNLIGEADTYQSMGNMFTGIGRLEDALNAFLKAKKLYHAEKAFLQLAITDTLIGILLLNYVILNEQTYQIASQHLEQALLYYSQQNLSDLIWKTNFYIADLNHKLFVINKDKEKSELYKNKARKNYLDMHLIIQEYANELEASNMNMFGLNLEDAYNKAYQFFLSIGEDDEAKKFTDFNKN
jgi:hypothetical protein